MKTLGYGILATILLLGSVAMFEPANKEQETTIKDIQETEEGIQINFKDGTGYWIEKGEK